ncbi:hypothetical protein LWC34_48395 [Kibdelosporangium philippinense]|uniref:Polymerase nucleotidyl transferase domain-containing protein n=1 Tax=Kibdelosporangium philippinense TaxID=211113 RepID=A0ABS8ZS67_9PSEU|nr:hypothetical protein [Kibdelosporangium philippinense]MCE7010574.1 hypothetical protein [Kibdelosporangium philippinense]
MDLELVPRQERLQAEGAELLRDLKLVERLAEAGPVLLAGSFVSGLMTWRELDVMVLVGPQFTPADVLVLMQRLIDLPGVVSFEFHDERETRCPTEYARDERYHLKIGIDRLEGEWCVDLSHWLHDVHANVASWHEELRGSVTPDQRDAILTIKDAQRQFPDYPGGLPIYTAVRVTQDNSGTGTHLDNGPQGRAELVRRERIRLCCAG